MSTSCEESLAKLSGKTIAFAQSSLNTFAIYLESQDQQNQKDQEEPSVVVIEAAGTVNLPLVSLSLKQANQQEKLSDAVCAVDWGWISGSKIDEMFLEGKILRLILSPAGPLTVTAAFWQSKPFLGFQPYRPAK